jgi:hypothetical protein
MINQHTTILILSILVLLLSIFIIVKNKSENFEYPTLFDNDKCWYLRNTSEWDSCMYMYQ